MRIVHQIPQPDSRVYNRGVALQRLNRFEEALASYARAVEVEPDCIDALINRGNLLRDLGRCEEALDSYDRAVKAKPDRAAAFYNRGALLYALNRPEEALASYARAIEVRPDYADALVNHGNVLRELGRLGEALESYDRAIATNPDNINALCNRSVTLKDLGRLEEALASCDRALALQPDLVNGLCNRAAVLDALQRFEEALASCDRAVALRPDYGMAFYYRGAVLHHLDRFEEALACYARGLELQPGYVEGLFNRGITLHELKKFGAALTSFDEALALQPDFIEARFRGALCRLLIGDFDEGWQGFGRRLVRSFSQPMWFGSDDIAGRTILLFAEEGLGDTIQFCRYAPLIAERGARVILEVQPPLQRLISTLPGIATTVSNGDSLPDFDVHCPLHTLPLALRTRLETIPATVPYLSASPQRTTQWRARLGSSRGVRVGLAWSGKPTHRGDHRRSMPLRTLLPLLDVEATFVSLQYEARPGDAAVLRTCPDLLDCSDELRDFSDTAALVANLDLVITVDTSVAHLAGALAKPVWVLLPFVPDWRWLLDRDDSPWYPTARLFRQDETRTWEGVIARVHTALSAWIEERKAPDEAAASIEKGARHAMDTAFKYSLT
jgi:tetratricopeptide (TPR) repeat protein